jgi:hypothetical protein
MFRSVSRIVFPSCRPIVISSRMSGMTVVFPSSSSMVSLNTAISFRGPIDDSIRGAADGQLAARVNPAPARPFEVPRKARAAT